MRQLGLHVLGLPDSPIDAAREFHAVHVPTVHDALENARAKASHGKPVRISIAFLANDERVELAVCDAGAAVEPAIAARLFLEPIERGSGLGIGLYHVARQARDAGFGVELASNRDGEVCFRLSREGR